ncbi:hypothetical protein Y032_0776g2262 [Ancylostoma ceylanicum]|uniref:7TM GPCR serpentine receptor class x (Srx) domain-containing protein n=1 Tax=Ancylostoma ceylanicum TaxID=53326 RepID=A0A016WCS0_9BILA|nr:hypothetical protein Y032_0776g2262 [Ancylostoma ceylanicum]
MYQALGSGEFCQFHVTMSTLLVVSKRMPSKTQEIQIIIGCGLVYGAGLSCEQVAEDCRFVYDLSRFSWVYVNCSMIVHSYIFVYPLLIFIALTLSTNVIIAIKLVSEASI